MTILVTDGQSSNRDKTVVAAKLMKEAGIHVFAIGVGKAVDFRELEEVASQPPEDFVYNVDDYKSLDAMKYIIANRTCRGILVSTFLSMLSL